ncbi:hypothetical protein [Litoreibacter meonggei]|nr:hypothetical protein [Litoreibacter meonggei]
MRSTGSTITSMRLMLLPVGSVAMDREVAFVGSATRRKSAFVARVMRGG